MALRIGIIENGITEDVPRIVASRCFGSGEANPYPEDIVQGGHLARLILNECPQAELVVAQILRSSRQASVGYMIEAIDWLVASGVRLINMGFGVQRAPLALQQCCRRAREAGVLIIGPAPAKGLATYPAAFIDCLAVSGDPRCANNEISWLNQGQVDFGANPVIPPGLNELRCGSSFACARVTGLAAALLAKQHPVEDIPHLLRERACFHGHARRTA